MSFLYLKSPHECIYLTHEQFFKKRREKNEFFVHSTRKERTRNVTTLLNNYELCRYQKLWSNLLFFLYFSIVYVYMSWTSYNEEVCLINKYNVVWETRSRTWRPGQTYATHVRHYYEAVWNCDVHGKYNLINSWEDALMATVTTWMGAMQTLNSLECRIMKQLRRFKIIVLNTHIQNTR